MRGLGTGSLRQLRRVTASAGRRPAVVRLVHSTRRKGRTTQARHEETAIRYPVAPPARRTTAYVAWMPSTRPR